MLLSFLMYARVFNISDTNNRDNEYSSYSLSSLSPEVIEEVNQLEDEIYELTSEIYALRRSIQADLNSSFTSVRTLRDVGVKRKNKAFDNRRKKYNLIGQRQRKKDSITRLIHQ